MGRKNCLRIWYGFRKVNGDLNLERFLLCYFFCFNNNNNYQQLVWVTLQRDGSVYNFNLLFFLDGFNSWKIDDVFGGVVGRTKSDLFGYLHTVCLGKIYINTHTYTFVQQNTHNSYWLGPTIFFQKVQLCKSPNYTIKIV
eukprot:TRINITY_DN10323_c0_g2_i6.p3 TRINITY_DN10323_c0_g2~~TRINITY_DN10323_c0_g2_i6.p3  ORF type:complete len:140 (-),score=1.57 TRINITY_DN10323_c0_g2_i6:37-456(-)